MRGTQCGGGGLFVLAKTKIIIFLARFVLHVLIRVKRKKAESVRKKGLKNQ